MKRTPLEKAIAAVADRRRRHDQRQAERGLVRVTVSVPKENADELRQVAEEMRARWQYRAIMGSD